MAMMAITTSNSIKVKPHFRGRGLVANRSVSIRCKATQNRHGFMATEVSLRGEIKIRPAPKTCGYQGSPNLGPIRPASLSLQSKIENSPLLVLLKIQEPQGRLRTRAHMQFGVNMPQVPCHRLDA